ncbi:adenylosuccinate synthase [Cohnella phaseoli]|uniref:Adenylosuccinate synthetase n=1 Tax=Cohnella phaseoli TaxID=456490 RepID=A0A3D9IRD1_9BACL|nr:adenylosuccinate synthase [Cohnella phaseoli]RED64302.1 adenylosuccinate synthetase [Cohnella phaseoli]
MTVTAIVGANWGDEGKGKMTDLCAEKASYVVRYQGGSNAGHTIINDYGKFALRMLPSGVFHPQTVNVIGPGVALDAERMLSELERLEERGVARPTVRLSERAQIVLPVHRLLDELEEIRLGAQSFGSTRNGIAPFYADKYAKLGIQVADLLHADIVRGKLERTFAAKNVLLEHLYGRSALEVGDLVDQLVELGEKLVPYVCDTTKLLQRAYANGESILLEGQLGALRDPDHGIYPYSTSSSTLAGHGAVGAGLPPYAISNVMAVVKAYSSCVGAGPFVSELAAEEAEELRRRGGDAGEYGVVTGRPRRVGWFDVVATRYGCAIQGATEVALTNLDVLGYLEEIPVCVGYEIDGTVGEDFPTLPQLQKAKPVLWRLPGWQSDISTCRSFDELPEEARSYVAYIESAVDVKITAVSVGPHRNQTIRRI